MSEPQDASAVDDAVVSVVVPYCPTYTPEPMLAEATESVAAQTGVETELLVVEDEDERGPAWARNVGLDRAETRYVALLDADDVWHPDKLQRQLREMDATGAALCVDGRREYSPLAFTGALLTGETHSLTSSILLDTEQVGVRFDESLERREDHLFMIAAAMDGGVCFTSETFFGRTHEDGFSKHVDTSPEAVDAFFERVLEVAPEARRFEAPYYATAYTYLGRRKHFAGAYRAAVGYYLRALRSEPHVTTVGALGLTLLAALYDSPSRVARRLSAGGTHE